MPKIFVWILGLWLVYCWNGPFPIRESLVPKVPFQLGSNNSSAVLVWTEPWQLTQSHPFAFRSAIRNRAHFLRQQRRLRFHNLPTSLRWTQRPCRRTNCRSGLERRFLSNRPFSWRSEVVRYTFEVLVTSSLRFVAVCISSYHTISSKIMPLANGQAWMKKWREQCLEQRLVFIWQNWNIRKCSSDKKMLTGTFSVSPGWSKDIGRKP